ncbi:MAG: M15 family metallopeptidase [bacterium]
MMKRKLSVLPLFLLLTLFLPVFRAAPAPNANALVDIRSVDRSILVAIPYATPNNFTHRKLYSANLALLRRPVAEALARVQRNLKKEHLGLKIWDAYRPLSVQKYMWTLLPDPRYVADPKKGSKHNRGAAVDVTLVDAGGRELEMPTGFDDFTPRAGRNDMKAPKEAIHNRKLLEEAMKAEGFIPFPSEWWHFDYKTWKEYGILDRPF